MRYSKNKIFLNKQDSYRRFLKSRGIKKITQYNTSKFRHPTVDDLGDFETVTHIWKTGDKWYKLADKYYQDPEKWWIIALYNQRPTEAHVSPGDVVYIPFPLESVLFKLGY
jgi:nucleoid-associated protein YgaU